MAQEQLATPRFRSRRRVYVGVALATLVLIGLGLLLVGFIDQAAQLNVNDQTSAAASSTAQAAGADIASDMELARTVSREDGLTAALGNKANPTTLQLLENTDLNLLEANPRITAFYFFDHNSSYIFGQANGQGMPMPVEQPPDWYGSQNRLRSTLQSVLHSSAASSTVLLIFDRQGDPYGTLVIMQPITSGKHTSALGALVEEVSGKSLFAPYLSPAKDNANLFLLGDLVISRDSSSFQSRNSLPTLHIDSSLDGSMTGGLRQTAVGFTPRGDHPSFQLHEASVVGSRAVVPGAPINGHPLQVLNVADASVLSTVAKRVLLLVAAFVIVAALGVAGLIIYIDQRLDREERRNARRIQAKNDALTAANAQLEILATSDPLTSLPNRALLHDRLESALRTAHRYHGGVALLLLDLDRFKEINDTLGHQCGDLLLCEVSLRLRQRLRDSDTIARLGGDEFALILPNATAAGATFVASQLLAALAEPLVIEDQPLDIGASIGIALFPDHGKDSPTLLRCADVAMYVAKRGRKGISVYESDQDQYTPRRLALMGELRQAIAQNALKLYYQPKVSPSTGRVYGVEALIRWPHPEHSFIQPDHFIPLAEHTDLIGPLTDWVLETAIDQCGRWGQKGLALDVAINMSMRMLHDGTLPDRISLLLRKHDVAPRRLTLEITESALAADLNRALDVLTQLANRGVRVSIDDFGTGYSSLGYLKRLPVHEIKLDKSFITNLGEPTGEIDVAIVRSVITLAQALNCTVVAEGVEHRAALDVLHGLGCDMVQGYYIARALPVPELETWITTSPWGRPRETAEISA
jgi:diguanylate cyclase (GGDEF)-like protein